MDRYINRCINSYIMNNISFYREELPYIVATASNTWGLFILAFLLGYGLVEVPRSLFNASRHTYTLNHCYFRAAKLYIDMAEANENLQDITEVRKMALSYCRM